jgi:glycogen synthase
VEPAITYSNLGLPQEWYGALGWVFPTWARTHALDTGEAVNFLKGAIVTADRIVTVSKVFILHITYFSSRSFIYSSIGVFVNYSNFFPFLIVDTQSTSF